jgi:NADPH:quinone reductase
MPWAYLYRGSGAATIAMTLPPHGVFRNVIVLIMYGVVICLGAMSAVTQRHVARALHPGGPEVIEVGVEDLAPLKAGEALVRIEAAGLNHAETLIRSGNYAVRLPFPYALGGEGSGTVVATGPEVTMPLGTRVCWGGILGSCATFVTAPASMLVPLPDALSFEDGACLPVAGLTAGGLVRVWPLKGCAAVVWGAAGAVGRMLVALLADRGVEVIGIASGKRVDGVRAAGAAHVIDRTTEDVLDAVHAYTEGRGVAAVFDPIGAATFETSLQLLGPRGCLINYGELSGPVPAINLHQLFPGSVFVTKYNGMRWVEGLHEFAGLISEGLGLAAKRRAVISDVAGRFPLDHVVEAYRALESGPSGKVLVIPNHTCSDARRQALPA